jgi:hypothetical protein
MKAKLRALIFLLAKDVPPAARCMLRIVIAVAKEDGKIR